MFTLHITYYDENEDEEHLTRKITEVVDLTYVNSDNLIRMSCKNGDIHFHKLVDIYHFSLIKVPD